MDSLSENGGTTSANVRRQATGSEMEDYPRHSYAVMPIWNGLLFAWTCKCGDISECFVSPTGAEIDAQRHIQTASHGPGG